LTEILHVFDPQFFWWSASEFSEWDYKIQPDSDHVAKFQGDRSRELGERVAKQKKKKKDTSRVKHKPVRNCRSGRAAYQNSVFAWLLVAMLLYADQHSLTSKSCPALADADKI